MGRTVKGATRNCREAHRFDKRSKWRFAVTVGSALIAAPLSGCNVFHASEIESDIAPMGGGGAGSAPEGGGDMEGGGGSQVDASAAGGGAGRDAISDSGSEQRTDAASQTFQVAEYCDKDVPVRMESSDVFVIDNTASLLDNANDLSGCGIARELRGGDGFLAVQMSAGEKWHFHLHGSADQDLALYLLPTCDSRSCTKAVDRCPKGQDEHMTVVVPSAGLYYLGLDGVEGPAGSTVTLLAVKPVCGDGKKVHSEGCDDGNITDGDGCDSRCRYEISNAGATAFTEAEPNGDTFSANVVHIPGDLGTVTIKGQTGGPCDTDVFAVKVPAGETLQAIMRNEANVACPAGVPTVAMKISDAQGSTLATGVPSAQSGTCPTVTLGPVAAAAEYYVSFATDNSTTPFKYQLEIDLK